MNIDGTARPRPGPLAYTGPRGGGRSGGSRAGRAMDARPVAAVATEARSSCNRLSRRTDRDVREFVRIVALLRPNEGRCDRLFGTNAAHALAIVGAGAAAEEQEP